MKHKPVAKPKGIRCSCGGETRIIKTRRSGRGLVVRRRECVDCGTRQTSDEKGRALAK